MIGSSVVPGLPNILTTPSSLSTRRKASRPVMVLVTRASGMVNFLPEGAQASIGHGESSPRGADRAPAVLAEQGCAGAAQGRADQRLVRRHGQERRQVRG